jgi:hypothetical protein
VTRKQIKVAIQPIINLQDEDLYDMFMQLSHDDAIKLILGVDLAMSEIGFTEKLIKGLVKSLKVDKSEVELPFIDWSKVK